MLSFAVIYMAQSLSFLSHQPAAFTFPGSLFLGLPLVVELLAAG
jgi:hypothetical protein